MLFSRALQRAFARLFITILCFQHINVVYRLSIAFVRYRLRASAEFAKLAMQNQVKSDEGSDKARLLVISPLLDSPSPGAGQQGMFESALGLR